MSRSLLLAAIWGWMCAWAAAQEAAKTGLLILPSEGKAAASVQPSADGRWLVLRDGAPVPGEAFALKAGGSILTFEGPPGGVYTVVFIPHDLDQAITATQMTLGGCEPPPPPPPPNGKWQVMLFYQSSELDNMPLAQRELIAGRKFREDLAKRGHYFAGAFDVDAIVRTSGELTTWWASVQGDPMPRVAVAPREGGDVAGYPLPADVAEFFKLLESL